MTTSYKLTKQRLKVISIVSSIVIAIIVSIIWGISYFNEQVTYLNGDKYRVSIKEDTMLFLKSGSDSITVYRDGHNRTVIIDDLTYKIMATNSNINAKRIVIYPNGQQFEVYGNTPLVHTMDGEYYSGLIITMNTGDVIHQDESYVEYHPAGLVEVAYEQYYTKQGVASGAVFSILMIVFGVVLFLSERLQLFFFMLKHHFDVVNPEPTDFYYRSTKIGAVGIVIMGIILFFMAL